MTNAKLQQLRVKVQFPVLSENIQQLHATVDKMNERILQPSIAIGQKATNSQLKQISEMVQLKATKDKHLQLHAEVEKNNEKILQLGIAIE